LPFFPTPNHLNWVKGKKGKRGGEGASFFIGVKGKGERKPRGRNDAFPQKKKRKKKRMSGVTGKGNPVSKGGKKKKTRVHGRIVVIISKEGGKEKRVEKKVVSP